MYKVLIADDEEIIRRGIRKLLSKCSQVEVVAMAEDGEEALEMSKEHSPDLLLVDINMPFLNGLDFIYQLKDVLEEPIIIIITGYDNFKYAQAALRLNVFDYILKPVMEDVFYAAIDRAVSALEEKRKESCYQEQTRLLLMQKKDIFKEEFMQEWVLGAYREKEATERMEYLGIQLPPDRFGLLVIRITKNYEARNEGEWPEDLLFFAVKNIVEELCLPLEVAVLFRNIRGNLVVICSRPDQKYWEELGAEMDAVVRQILPAQVKIFRGEGAHTGEIPPVYQEVMDENDRNNENPELVNKILVYLEKHYGNPDLSLQAISDTIHISPQYMNRLFKNSTGTTIMEYLARIRMKHATRLLAGTNLKIYEIAEQVGYANQHYFSNAFKKLQGISPIDYRKGY